MPKKYIYSYLESVGPYGVLFIEEKEPILTNCGTKQRVGIFKCPFCQNYFSSRISDIKSGRTRSCGCYHKKLNHELFYKDITNCKFGRLTALYPYNNNYKKWVCLCDCGKETIVDKNNLTSGNTSSCGCLREERNLQACLKDITNKRFGKLTALFPINNSGKRIWHCICDCGNYTDVQIDCLMSGNTQSCGCSKSKGEEKIVQVLKELHIKFIQQHKFIDCVNPNTNWCLYFDFYLSEYNICIEYDGIQHYKAIDFFNKKDSLETIQFKDNIKNNYCLKNNIKLIRIPYFQLEDINCDYLKQLICL